MTNTSATGGYLAPSSTAPADDDALVDFLQTVIVGITGLAGMLVRPRWQPEPANLPDYGTSWAAFGLAERRSNAYPYVEHESDGQGTDTAVNYETFKLEASFYGPLASANATYLRDGLVIAQNREQLGLAGIALVALPTDIIALPSLLKERWLFRVDMPIWLTREIRRTYPVLNLLSAAGTIHGQGAGNLTTPFNAH